MLGKSQLSNATDADKISARGSRRFSNLKRSKSAIVGKKRTYVCRNKLSWQSDESLRVS